MFELIAKIADQGLAVMLVEQNVVETLELAARGYVMENGRFVIEGRSGDLASDPKLKNAYLGM